MELRAWRRAQRAALAAALAALPTDERRRASAAIDDYLLAELEDRRGGAVGAYWPIRGEFDVLPLVARLRAQGVTIALPAVVAPGQPLEFRRWDPDRPLARDAFDFAYPADGAAVVVPDVLVVPLLGFDAAGFRLGYGSGYYDRTLAALHPRPRTLGVGFECTRLPTIRPQGHDVPLDAIVTERGVQRRGESAIRSPNGG